MISSSQFVYQACVTAMNAEGLTGSELVYPLLQDDADEATTIVYSLVSETRYQSIDGFGSTDSFEINIRSDDYALMRRLDNRIINNLQVDNRLLTIEAGADFVEDVTGRQNKYGRRRVVEID